MIPVNIRVLQVQRLAPPWVIAHTYAKHAMGVSALPSLLIISSGLAVPEGSDYLDGKDVSPLAFPSCAIPH